jgi:cysteine synthase A
MRHTHHIHHLAFYHIPLPPQLFSTYSCERIVEETRPLSSMERRSLTTVALVVASSLTTIWGVRKWQLHKRRHQQDESGDHLTAYEQLIESGTPLVKLRRVSDLIGRSVYVKMESMNPGGTGKDRAALNMIRTAENLGHLPPPTEGNCGSAMSDLLLKPSLLSTTVGETSMKSGTQLEQMVLEAIQRSRSGGLVVEGTSGSTGIALATLCAARGHACLVVLPDDQAVEKQRILRSLGAVVYEVPTAAISNPNHYVNLARKAAQLAKDRYQISAVFIDQFENIANFDIHYKQTGPELWMQMNQQIDAFVMSSGTGGTISGVASFLKGVTPFVEIVLVDPPGSALYNKVQHGIAYTEQQQERTVRKHRYDTLAEGIGLDRLTQNFEMGLSCIDRAIRVTDQEAVDMAHWILRTEGLWMGSSSAMNLVAAIRTALELPKDSRVVTIMCDGGQRHATRFWNPTFIQDWGLRWPEGDTIPECLQSAQSKKLLKNDG